MAELIEVRESFRLSCGAASCGRAPLDPAGCGRRAAMTRLIVVRLWLNDTTSVQISGECAVAPASVKAKGGNACVPPLFERRLFDHAAAAVR